MHWVGKAINESAYPGLKCSVGRYSYGNPKILWEASDRGRAITVGSFCSIAEGVKIFVGKFGRHPTDRPSTFPLRMVLGDGVSTPHSPPPYVNKNLDVHIGADVWIGRDATIMSGVTIGHGAVIGANALVTKDVADYAIVGGVSARVLRYRFNPTVIDQLLTLKWWDLDDAQLASLVPYFESEEIEVFVSKLTELRSQSS